MAEVEDEHFHQEDIGNGYIDWCNYCEQGFSIFAPGDTREQLEERRRRQLFIHLTFHHPEKLSDVYEQVPAERT